MIFTLCMVKDVVEYFHTSHAEGWSDCDSKPTNFRLRIETQHRPFVFEKGNFIRIVIFAVITNEPQGQTYEHTGVYLEEPVCSNGQIYFAVVFARNWDST
jgi:hypothetical protein